MTGGVAVVIGGTGFVGRHVCQALGLAGYEVVSVSRRAPRPAQPHPNQHLRMDLAATGHDAVATVLASCRAQIVVNATGGIWGLSDEQMRSAITAPTVCLVEALELLTNRPRLVHLGSVLEYGPLPWGTALGRGTVPRPGTPYGKAKLAATQAVQDAVGQGWLDAVVLRLANVAGPGCPALSLLGVVTEQLLRAREPGARAVVTLDRLRAHRDYVDVRDVAEAVAAAASVPSGAASREAVPIGSGDAVPVQALVRRVIARSGVDARVVERATPTHRGGGTPEEWVQVDTGVAGELLGWRPRYSIDDMLDAYAAEAFASLTTT